MTYIADYVRIDSIMSVIYGFPQKTHVANTCKYCGYRWATKRRHANRCPSCGKITYRSKRFKPDKDYYERKKTTKYKITKFFKRR